VETVVGAPTLEATEAVDASAQGQEETEQDTVPVSQPSSPVSTAATAVASSGFKVETQVRSTHEDANEILMILEKTMERVCEWSERNQAQSSAIAERDVQVWKRRLVNCEEALKRKVAALTEAEKEQVALR
jgi:hypothetical protein